MLEYGGEDGGLGEGEGVFLNRRRSILLLLSVWPLSDSLLPSVCLELDPPIPSLLLQAASYENLRPAFVLGIAWRESRYLPGVISSKGAVGVMQLMPLTSKVLGVHDPFDPRQNIAAGVRYLGTLYHRYHSEKVADCVYGFGERYCLTLIKFNENVRITSSDYR